MSSRSHHKMTGVSSKPRKYDIQYTVAFSEQMAQLCMNDSYSDVTFLVENQRLPAHRVILAARSDYFRALLYGGLSESHQNEIQLKIPVDAFKALLQYIYSGQMPLSHMTEENVLDTLGLANQYGFTELEQAISDYLREYLALENVCSVLDAARLYNLENLISVCLTFMDRNADAVLHEESFAMLSRESLEEVLRRDSFFAPEVDIFLAVWEWCRQNGEIDIESCVRLPLIDIEDLLKTVRPSGILNPNKLLDAIAEQTTSKYLPYRAALWPDQNLASAKFGSRTTQGECASALLDGDFSTYDMEKGYTRHCINDQNDSGIVVELGTICIVNHIKMLLWDRDSRTYSYFIEVSVNQTHWNRVIDYSDYYCRSWQYLYFEPRPVRYIRLVGTFNNANKVFHVVGLEAMYSTTMPKVVNGFVAPTANVATIEMSAVVIDGVSRTRNALLNGDYKNYDWDSGYTCHQLGSGDICVRLGQPYYVDSMRLLLWDCDDRTYSFYIETSTNQKDWQMIVDKRTKHARSWQNFTFTPRPVVFIRIVGTHNTANEIFHCVHLECPSQDESTLKSIEQSGNNGVKSPTAMPPTATTASTPAIGSNNPTNGLTSTQVVVRSRTRGNSTTQSSGASTSLFTRRNSLQAPSTSTSSSSGICTRNDSGCEGACGGCNATPSDGGSNAGGGARGGSSGDANDGACDDANGGACGGASDGVNDGACGGGATGGTSNGSSSPNAHASGNNNPQ